MPERNFGRCAASLGALDIATSEKTQIDDDGAGRGWVIAAEDGSLKAPGQYGYDLLTVVTHELGHLIGHDHDHDHDSIMAPTLAPIAAAQASPGAITLGALTDGQPESSRAQPELQGSPAQLELQDAVDQVLSEQLIDDLRMLEEDEKDLLGALTGEHETDQQEQGSLFAALGLN